VFFLAISGFADQTSEHRSDALALWAQNHAEFLQSNEENIEKLFRRSHEIKGIELIVAGAIDQRVESRFGHSLLRFVFNEGPAVEDLVLSFVALVDEPMLDYRKGVNGGYQVLAMVTPLGRVLQTYLEGEERQLDRYVIPTNLEMRKSLIENLRKGISTAHGFGVYKFFSSNCAGVLVRLLNQSGVPAGPQLPIPSALPEQMAARHLTPFAYMPVPTVAPIFKRLAKQLSVPESDLRAGEWPLHSIPLLERLSVSTLAKLFFIAPPVDDRVREKMLQLIRKNGRPNLDEIYSLTSVPSEVYGLCAEKTCAMKVVSAMNASGLKLNHKTRSDLFTNYARTQIDLRSPLVKESSRVFVRHRLLLYQSGFATP